MNQSIFTDAPHDQLSLLAEDHSLGYEDQQHFNNEEHYDHAAEESSSLAVPYDPYSQEEGAQEDDTGNYMDQATDPHSYFTVGVQDNSDPHAVVLD